MLNDWAGCIDELLGVQGVSDRRHLLVLGARFLLCSMSVLAALPHLQTARMLGYSVQCPVFGNFLYFQVVIGVLCTQFWVNIYENPIIGQMIWPCSDFLCRISAVVIDYLKPITSRQREKLVWTTTPCSMLENISRTTLERSMCFESVYSCSRHQSVMSGIQNVLQISIWLEW